MKSGCHLGGTIGLLDALDLLHQDLVRPVVPKVIPVGKPQPGLEDLAQLRLAFVDDGGLPEILRAGNTISRAVDEEFMEVGIGPAHGRLEDVMELMQAHGAVDPDHPPDGGLDVSQLYPKTVGVMEEGGLSF